jgi:AAA15 family ATPase/GTPase
LLGPLYDSIKSNYLLIIDELDSKFHTLLTKEVLKIFHKFSTEKCQLIAVVQDSCLMDTSFIRPDQIWFIDKDWATGKSEIYSLVEYKIKKKQSYSTDYLNGLYGAIPLFSSYEDIDNLMIKELTRMAARRQSKAPLGSLSRNENTKDLQGSNKDSKI